jgi:cullin-associated NEDD8-dissociated protein 1
LKNDLVDTGLGILETYFITLTKEMEHKYADVVVDLLTYKTQDDHFENLAVFDPSYNYESVHVSSEYDEYDCYNYQDNEDSSWKVRRSSVKILMALIKSKVSLKKPVIKQIIEALVHAMREHSENVRLEVINCLRLYIRNFIIESGIN